MRLRRLLLIAALLSSRALAQDMTLTPLFGTQLRYEQSAADTLIGINDGLLLRARPGIGLSTNIWSLEATSDASIAVRRDAVIAGALTSRTPRPQGVGLSELRVQYRGIPKTAIVVGRQHLGMADAAITGDRDGEQTFDAARMQWKGLPGLSADLAYAWSSTSRWAADRPVPENIAGQNIFAQVNWRNSLGTLSTYAYQIDQRHAANSDFRLLNQVVGARLSGARKINEAVKLNYSLGYVRQSGLVENAAGGAPTYWLMGSTIDFADPTASNLNYKRFAANGISTLNGDKLSLATNATNGRVTLGAAFNAFRPLPDTNAVMTRDLRVSLGLIF